MTIPAALRIKAYSVLTSGGEMPQRGSLERHRLVKLWVDANPHELRSKRFFISHPSIRDLIEPLASSYKTADLLKPADFQIDVEKINLTDVSFDVIEGRSIVL